MKIIPLFNIILTIIITFIITIIINLFITITTILIILIILIISLPEQGKTSAVVVFSQSGLRSLSLDSADHEGLGLDSAS